MLLSSRPTPLWTLSKSAARSARSSTRRSSTLIKSGTRTRRRRTNREAGKSQMQARAILAVLVSRENQSRESPKVRGVSVFFSLLLRDSCGLSGSCLNLVFWHSNYRRLATGPLSKARCSNQPANIRLPTIGIARPNCLFIQL